MQSGVCSRVGRAAPLWLGFQAIRIASLAIQAQSQARILASLLNLPLLPRQSQHYPTATYSKIQAVCLDACVMIACTLFLPSHPSPCLQRSRRNCTGCLAQHTRPTQAVSSSQAMMAQLVENGCHTNSLWIPVHKVQPCSQSVISYLLLWKQCVKLAGT